jgi:biotin transport system substrate-specific component
MNTQNPTLASRFWPATTGDALRTAVLAVLGSFAVAVAAQIQVPMLPVPMTLQTLAVLAIGAGYGARLGALTMALYALEGLAGLPVFAGLTAGPAILAGPTGGYIAGFVIAAYVTGRLAERGWDRSELTMLAAMLAGAAVLYVPGLLWLQGFVGGPAKALEFGLYPFVVGDLVKAGLAALAFPAVWRLLGTR